MKLSRKAAILLSAGILAVPGVAGALGGPPASNYHQEPSCSLYPHRLGNGEYVFQNQNPNGDWEIPLTVWDATNENIVFQGFLGTNDTTPILSLSLVSGIGWSNNHEGDDWTSPGNATYSLGDYEQVDWCGSPNPNSTTTTTVPEEPTTTVPDTTTTTVNELTTTTTTTAPVVTTEPLPTPKLNCEELGRTNIPATDPLYRIDLDADGDGMGCDADVSVAGIVATRPVAEVVSRPPLPQTGNSSTPWFVAAASALIAAGAGLVARTRRTT